MKKLMTIVAMALLLSGVFVVFAQAQRKDVAQNKKRTVQIYGHRGARGLSPENTMPAYGTALKIGVDIVDMDIAITKDGVIVVQHDYALNPNLTRATKGNWITEKVVPNLLVQKMTLEQLEKYDVGTLKPGTAYAKYFPYQVAVPGTKIPTLKQVVDHVKKVSKGKVKYQIEIKTDPNHPEWTVHPAEFARILNDFLAKEGLVNDVEVQSFEWKCLVELNKLNPKVKTAYLTDMQAKDPDANIWLGIDMAKYGHSYPKAVKALGGACWEPYEAQLTKRDLDLAHFLGLKVVVWGWPEQEGSEFDPAMVSKLIAWGVDGIITDRPDILRGFLAARGYDVPVSYIDE